MCGIVGLVNLDGCTVDQELIVNMRDQLSHRGPDGAGVWCDGPVGFAHRRLAVIDLSELASQPMTTTDGSLTITFNGEIYNFIELRGELQRAGYSFRTGSDTEVLLHGYAEWGTDLLQRLNGMFAFAIWDTRRQVVFVARDRLGIKPFYFLATPRRFSFASEIKALLADPACERKADLRSVADYALYQFTLGDKTWFKGVRKLEPGSYLVLTLDGKASVKKYWDLSFDKQRPRPRADLAEELRHLLQDAVRLQLRSDVPLGCHLSGGLDSSTVATLAAQQVDRVKTFTGRFDLGGEFDESRYAKILASAIGAEYHEVTPNVGDFQELLPQIGWHMDEPQMGPGVFPQFMVSALASRHVKVVLGGQGGDELFVGYPRYVDLVADHFLLHPGARGWETQRLRTMNRRLRRIGPFGAGIWLLLRGLWPFTARYRRAMTRNVSLTREFRRLLGGYDPVAEFHRLFNQAPTDDPLNRMVYFDLKQYLPGLLHVEDRTSMAFSLESRVPLLDHRLVEWMASIPPWLRCRDYELKPLLRGAMEKQLPREIVERRDKLGFPTPTREWFDGPLLDMADRHRARAAPIGALPPWEAVQISMWADIFKVDGVPLDDLRP